MRFIPIIKMAVMTIYGSAGEDTVYGGKSDKYYVGYKDIIEDRDGKESELCINQLNV
ncbi:hypothetical protein CPIN18021_0519 [Campylobacter pinnipediorum subsp. caledonicus]|uniref:Uncharacterized protein n=2 Tax=Campylobacter TaxID=194 RepID=A0A1S6U6L4_9BACT|nr:hypothetical protein CPIN18020_0514 [Campylobacter pinnipediorum subsp. caledonicus]AQW87353.1 hypothetical protein CPIN18021_0519 [Campylobacter pinnipediorum subsp. caledonicus]